jgi:DNA-binding transcriptional LysR family regulator
MDLDETRTLLALAEEGSVSGAAERMGVSRATVRRRLAALEARVGVSLARSTEAGVELTAAGELYARHARAPVRELEAIGQLAERAGQDPAGTLDVALPVGASRRLGPLFVRRLLTAWPDLRVRLRATPDPVKHLSHGADAALTLTLPTAGELVVVAIGRITTGLYGSPDYVARMGQPRSLGDLAQHTLLHTILDAEAAPHTLAQHSEVRWPLRAGGDVSVTPRILSTDNEFIQGCVADGMGIAILPDYAARGLVPLLSDAVGLAATVWGVTTRAGTHLPRVRAGLEVAAQLFAEGLG